jgi:hypothetical protein
MDPILAAKMQVEKTQLKTAEKAHFRKTQELNKPQQSEAQLRTSHPAYQLPPGTGLFATLPELSPRRKLPIEPDDFVDPDDLPTTSVLGRRSFEEDDNDEGPTRKRSRYVSTSFRRTFLTSQQNNTCPKYRFSSVWFFSPPSFWSAPGLSSGISC